MDDQLEGPVKKRGRDKNIKDTSDEPVGGFAFFLSLLLLLPTGLLFFALAVTQLREADLAHAAIFLMSSGFGALLAKSAIRGHVSVLLHEFKHRLVANLAGNKFKKMVVNENSGYMQYSYTERTAHYNAFIALAPYIVPVFTFVMFLIAISTFSGMQGGTIALIGLGYGMDLELNIRDISPIQTDISLIRGGYFVGLLYILAWNLIIAAFVCSWAFRGSAGIGHLFETISRFFFAVYFGLSGTTPEG